MGQGELEGMPEPAVLRLHTSDGQVLVTWGRVLVYRYEADDIGMRNLAIVALTDAGRRVDEVAAVFGLTATYVSILRGRARTHGSVGLVARRGRPPKLNDRQVARARVWAGQGWTKQAISERLGVARSVISVLLARLGPAPVQDGLPATSSTEPEHESTVAEPDDTEATKADLEPVVDEPAAELVAPPAGSAAIGAGSYPCRYAGAMMLYPYLYLVGAQAIFATCTGGPARRYSDLGVLTTAVLGFALGAGTVEATKHLRRAEAGAAVGLAATPELSTLRARLSALADGSDPLGLQRAFAAGMLAADPAGDAVYFVDDHFVPYAGARPVAKGWNTKRRHAQPGRDDTLVVDARGRAVVFSSGEPTGLASNLPGVLRQLREVLGPHAPILLGFDRGGSYPSAFTTCRDAGADWVSYRRAPLVATTANPTQATITRGGKQVMVMLADEAVQIKGYGAARQLTLFEHDAPVLQVLTSDTTATAVGLLYWLRARWRIENMFKYAAEHNGIDALADYGMDIGPDTRKVTNPARTAARTRVADAQEELATAERALPQLLNGQGTPKQKNAALPGVHRRIDTAIAAAEGAKTALRPIPAKVAATDLDPDAKLARPHIGRRGLQMVLRLLAFNAEAWLAEHFNAYLADPNEYRAILRSLLHLGGQVDYTTNAITITLDRPDSPRVARALQLLTEELNATPTVMPTDSRPLTYQLATT
jgi:Helix-turn-helix domain